MSKTLQQLDKEFKVRREILKEIEETSFSGMYAGDVVKEVIKWQSQLKNLSKEEKPVAGEELKKGDMVYLKEGKYFKCEEKPEKELSKDNSEKDLREKILEILAGQTIFEIKDKDLLKIADQILALLETHPKEKDEGIEKLYLSRRYASLKDPVLVIADKIDEIITRLNNL